MTINLNSKTITKELLLNKLTDIEIYKMYLPKDTEMSGISHSPFRDDLKPSFGFFVGKSGELCFNDFVLGSGDCIKFVMLKFGLSFFEALSKIALDAGLESEFIIKNTFKTNVNSSNSFKTREEIIKDLNTKALSKTSREWTIVDLAFWSKFGITKKTLEDYRVSPVSYLHIGLDKKIIKADQLSYCYTEYKDGKETFKIYQPSNKQYKWLNNHNSSTWQGWDQLPQTGKKLIITKSLKDVMAIKDVMGIPAVSLQTESSLPKEQVIDELKKRFDTIFVLYDNDYDKETNWGRQFGNNLSDKFNLFQIEIDEKLESKDFSDLVKNKGAKTAKEYLLTILIEVPF
jgi:hypothetical protein